MSHRRGKERGPERLFPTAPAPKDKIGAIQHLLDWGYSPAYLLPEDTLVVLCADIEKILNAE
jgi:hypothetical protein